MTLLEASRHTMQLGDAIKHVFLIDDGGERHWYVAHDEGQAFNCFLLDCDVDEPEECTIKCLDPDEPLPIGYEWEPSHIELSNALEHGPRNDGWWRFGITKRAADWAAETEVGCLASTLV